MSLPFEAPERETDDVELGALEEAHQVLLLALLSPNRR